MPEFESGGISATPEEDWCSHWVKGRGPTSPMTLKYHPTDSSFMWTENEKIQGAEMDKVTYLFLSHTLSQNMCPIALSKMTEPDLIRPFNLTSSLENMVGRGWGLRTSKSHHRCTIHNVTAEWSRKRKEYSSSPVMCAHYLGFYSINQL